VQFCRDWKVSSKKIVTDFHVDEVLEEAEKNDLGDMELAAAILWNCCCTEGRFNNSSLVFLAVVKFLMDRQGDVGTQPFLDLGAMLKAGTTAEAVRKWLATHYS